MDALRSHGYMREALRLAVVIVRTLKQRQRQQQQLYQQMLDKGPYGWKSISSSSRYSSRRSTTHRTDATATCEGWIGHSLDPVGCLFDTLTEASIIPDDNNTPTTTQGQYLYIIFENKCDRKGFLCNMSNQSHDLGTNRLAHK